jgi:hypothetical protein
MTDLIGKIVEVSTVEIIYIGRLVEINDNEIHLETEMGWIVIPVDRVAYVREKNGD